MLQLPKHNHILTNSFPYTQKQIISFSLSLSNMASLANLNGVSEVLPSIPKPLHCDMRRTQKRRAILGFSGNKTQDDGNAKLEISRRLVLGFASAALVGNFSIGNSLAEDNNGLWINGPLPVPSVNNKIANEETGTRSFLKKGIYMANIGTKGSVLRLRKYAFDLIALGDLLGQDAWNYVRHYLRLKSTFMYYDFDKVISAATVDEKPALTDLANRLFDNFEKLEAAVRKHDTSQTDSYYQETTSLLQEVMTRMA